MRKKIKKTLVIISIISVIILILALGIYFILKKDSTKIIPELNENNYTSERINAGISDEYTLSSSDYDYNDPAIKKVINDIKTKNYKTTEEIIQAVGDYVYLNVNYDGNLTYYDCTSNSASSVLNRGYGLCSTMSKLDITILRGFGISARPMDGCINTDNYQCTPLFQGGVYQSTIQNNPVRKPRSNKITIKNGIATTKGGLHTWVEVWLPERNWTILESTTGYLVDRNCKSYILFKTNPLNAEMCGLNYLLYKKQIDSCSNF